MKYVVVLYDGMADYPNKELGDKTPLEIAKKPNMDYLQTLEHIKMKKNAHTKQF